MLTPGAGICQSVARTSRRWTQAVRAARLTWAGPSVRGPQGPGAASTRLLLLACSAPARADIGAAATAKTQAANQTAAAIADPAPSYMGINKRENNWTQTTALV